MKIEKGCTQIFKSGVLFLWKHGEPVQASIFGPLQARTLLVEPLFFQVVIKKFYLI